MSPVDSTRLRMSLSKKITLLS